MPTKAAQHRLGLDDHDTIATQMKVELPRMKSELDEGTRLGLKQMRHTEHSGKEAVVQDLHKPSSGSP